MPLGTFATRVGPFMGAYDIFEIVATGKGAHAAMPYAGKDPMLFAAHAISALQTIVARNLHPQDAGVVSVTQVHGGDTWNVIPQEVVLRGTVRTFDPAVQDLIEQRMRTIVAGIAAMFEMTATVRYERRYPATVNAEAQTKHAIAAASAVVGAANVDTDPVPEMGSEDFSFMLQAKPGCYVWLGAGRGPGHAERAQPALRLQRRRAPDRRELLGDARAAAAPVELAPVRRGGASCGSPAAAPPRSRARPRRWRSLPSTSCSASLPRPPFLASSAAASSRSLARIAVSASTVTRVGCTSRNPPWTNTSSSLGLAGELDAHGAGLDLRQERRVARIDAELAHDAGQHDELRLAGEDLLLGADDVDVDGVGHGGEPS